MKNVYVFQSKGSRLNAAVAGSKPKQDNLENVRWAASKYFRNKKKEYTKAKIDELENKSKIKNIRDL